MGVVFFTGSRIVFISVHVQ